MLHLGIVILYLIVVVDRGKCLPVDQGSAAVLLAAQVLDEGEGVVGLSLVGGSVVRRADNHHGEGRVSYDYHGKAERDDIPYVRALAVSEIYCKETQHQQYYEEEGRTAVERQMEYIDEEQVEYSRNLGQVGNDAPEHYGQDNGGESQHSDAAPGGDFGGFFIVVDKCYRGYDQQVQQMHSYRQAHQEGYGHYPAVGILGVGLFLPFENHPEHRGGEQGGHRVDLGLHGGEPEGIGPAVGQGAHYTGSYQGQGLSHGELSGTAVLLYDTASQVHDGQIEEKYGECGA